MRRFTVVCNDERAAEIERLAEQYELSEQAVLRQLVGLGLESLD